MRAMNGGRAAAAAAQRLTLPLAETARERVRRALAAGEALTFPTETSYALGGNALSAALVATIYRLKGRERGKPLLLLVDGGAGLERWARDVPAAARALVARFWPGPLTLVLRAGPALPAHLGDERGTVALRWSPHPAVAELLALGGVPLIGSSANRSGTPPLHSVAAVLGAFPGEPLLALDGGPTAGGPPSTVLDATVMPFTVVREGAISVAEIRAALAGAYPEAAPA
jgi:L-threonylcarbamoyladenylate synthase